LFRSKAKNERVALYLTTYVSNPCFQRDYGGSKVVYKNIVNLLKNKINSPLYNIGDLLPAEKELAELYDVSRNTLRKALKTLEEDGLIERRHGSGTWIRNKHFQASVTHLDSFTEIARNQGKRPPARSSNSNYSRLGGNRVDCNCSTVKRYIMLRDCVLSIILRCN
jgi:DNA-binding transcriptional regulator YhcF (GntR family)